MVEKPARRANQNIHTVDAVHFLRRYPHTHTHHHPCDYANPTPQELWAQTMHWNHANAIQANLRSVTYLLHIFSANDQPDTEFVLLADFSHHLRIEVVKRQRSA